MKNERGKGRGIDYIDPIETRKTMPFYVRLLIVFLIITLPILLTMVAFAPFVAKKFGYKHADNYILKEGFGRKDLDDIVALMNNDDYFAAYFVELTKLNIQKISDEVYAILDQNRSRKSHYETIEKMQTHVDALGILINSLNIPKDFAKDPLRYTVISDHLWRFLYEEFKLSIVAACYKSTYNIHFQLKWNDSTKDAAAKLQKIFRTLNYKQRRAMGNYYSSR